MTDRPRPWRIRFHAPCVGASPYRRVYRFHSRSQARAFVRTIRSEHWRKGSIIAGATVSAPVYAPLALRRRR